MSAKEFTIRAYGLLLHEGAVLVADQLIKGERITKFPGGGLEFGEGLKDCLVREIKEELDVRIVSIEHFYTTDFFQQSIFHNTPMQVIAVYYLFSIEDPGALRLLSAPFAFSDQEQKEGFRWLKLEHAQEEDVSLPIDKQVLRMLIERSR